MRYAHFWKDGQVVSVERDGGEFTGRAIFDAPCVDERYDRHEIRYGLYEDRHTWKHIPLKDFPKEFRATLLLMGVA